jgi:hypothetical protein
VPINVLFGKGRGDRGKGRGFDRHSCSVLQLDGRPGDAGVSFAKLMPSVYGIAITAGWVHLRGHSFHTIIPPPGTQTTIAKQDSGRNDILGDYLSFAGKLHC